MTETSSLDYSAAYRSLREQLTDLLAEREAEELEQLAPATPEWRVRDVVSHMAGVCDDVLNGNMAGAPSNAWTQAQVEKRLGWPFPRVVDDWTEHGTAVESFMNDIGNAMGQMVFDAWTHEQDVRGALGEPGGRDGATLEIAFGWFVDANQAAATPDQPGTLLLVTEVGEARLGPHADATTTIRASRYEFLRSVTGRRSLRQVRSLDFDGTPPDEVLFNSEIFRPAETDIIE
jgi:uncharacterized protein (TIGR03083 family)